LLNNIEVGPQSYRNAMARFAGAVHVITTDGAAGRRGTTVIAALLTGADYVADRALATVLYPQPEA
jgi:hypothetical protein